MTFIFVSYLLNISLTDADLPKKIRYKKENIKLLIMKTKGNFLKETLGIKLYSKVFRIFLTDNGSEFFFNSILKEI